MDQRNENVIVELQITHEDIAEPNALRNKLHNFKGFQENREKKTGTAWTEERREKHKEIMRQKWRERKKEGRKEGRRKKGVETNTHIYIYILIFNPCSEFRRSPEGPVSQIHYPHLHVGAPGIFSDLLRCVQVLKREWGAEGKRKLPHLYISLVKLQSWFFGMEDLLSAELKPRFLRLQ